MIDIDTNHKYMDDIKRIIKAGIDCNVVLTTSEANGVWVDYSDTFAAGWLILPSSDEVLRGIVESYIQSSKEDAYDYVLLYDEWVQTCGACPTMFEFVNSSTNDTFSFRLRHGYVTLALDGSDNDIVDGMMVGYDGVCSFDEAISWLEEQGVKLMEVKKDE